MTLRSMPGNNPRAANRSQDVHSFLTCTTFAFCPFRSLESFIEEVIRSFSRECGRVNSCFLSKSDFATEAQQEGVAKVVSGIWINDELQVGLHHEPFVELDLIGGL